VNLPTSQNALRRARSRPASALALAAALCLFGIVHESTSTRAAAPAVAQPTATDEYTLKAAFLYNFARYVKWPDTAFKDKDAPLRVAVVGQDPFGKILDDALRDKKAGTHPIATVRFESIEKLGDCHILFVPASEEKNLARIQELTKDKPILLVTESLSAAEHGAHIGFFLEKSKAKFAVNTESVKASKLEVSSELLKLAKILESKSKESAR
jgi:hypothetical protein